ncbi:TPA_asm: L [Cypripedium gammacytorhabdovirus 1]|nr:TPA_asm: L [Cypripedium gammacytorhabdovirus 1]
MNQFWDLNFSQPQGYKGLRDYHLRSALTSDNLKLEQYNSWDKKILNEIKMFNENFKICNRDPCKILGRILESSPMIPTYGKEIYFSGVCLKVEGQVYKSLKTPLFENAANTLMQNILYSRYYMPSKFFQRAIIISNAMQANKDYPQQAVVSNVDRLLGIVTQRLESLDITLKIGSECFGVQLGDNLLSIHHVDHMQDWSIKCVQRFDIEIACMFGVPMNYLIYPPMESIYEFWGIWDSALRSSGNIMYKCIKIFESMVIGVILDKNPNKVINPITNFLDVIMDDFKKSLDAKCQILSEYSENMKGFLNEDQSMQYLSQFYGLYRTWGHPVVKPKVGMEKVHKLGTMKKIVSQLIPMQIRRIFMLRYAVWHKGARGCYPLCQDYVEKPSGNIIRDLLQNDSSCERLEQTLNDPEWDEIRFKKCIEIPKTYNLAEMVADRAISPDRDGLLNMCKSGKNMYDANLRRGVLQWLLRTPETCENFLTRINENGLHVNELIIGLYQKEREVNETPRMFSLMSHSIRNYIVTTESMISTDILPSFPNITMTDSLLSLQKKIYAVSHKQSQNNKHKTFHTFKDVTIVVNIDFEKWNLNFRRETTFPLFEAIGDLYGLSNLYNRTYDIFENSIIYLADGSYRLKIVPERNEMIMEPPLSYIGHIGGFEGLRQKGWTVFTDCGLSLICSRHKCSYTIMGQGDNQVLALTWKTYMLDENREVSSQGKEILSRQFSRFMSDLTSTFGSLGLPVKALETWTSENLFLYGKFPTLSGIPLAMSLKKICRAYYLANEEIMTLDCSLSTIQSNAMAACMSDVTSFVPYVIYKIQVFLALDAFYDYHVLLGRGAFQFSSGDSWKFTTAEGSRYSFILEKPLTKWKFLVVLSWFPKILGGVSVASWYDFLMRGFPDKVSSAFTWIKHLMSAVSDQSVLEVLRNIYQCHINPEKNFTLLVEDPCALNLIVPVDARASVRQSVQELFENITNVKNTEFLSLFKFNNEWDKRSFCSKLCEGDILHPRFLHDVAASTLGGYVDSIVSKVSKASTINKLALRSSLRNPGNKIEKHGSHYMTYLLWKTMRCSNHRSYIENICPTEQARAIRLLSWGKVLEGVSVPHPMAFLEFRDCSRCPKSFDLCDGNFISISLPEVFCSGNLESIHSLGSSPPYLGSETKEKLGADPLRQVFGKEPLIKRPLSLLRVVNWFVSPGSIAEELIFSLLTSVSDLNPSDYVSREMGITGSEAHRYRDQALKHGVMSANMYTLGSHMHISTDPWKKYTRGADNYTIPYQAVLCTLQSLVGGHLFYCNDTKSTPLREYHFHESCTSCIVALSDEFHDFNSREIVALVPSGKNNSYLWVSEESLSLKYKYDPQLKLCIPEISYSEYLSLPNKREVLVSWIANSIFDDITSSGVSQHGPRLLDSKDYPRVMYKKMGVKELWEETAKVLISQSGVKYSSIDSARISFPSTARELAADDLMKCSSSALMGLSMFYTWPEKFAEVALYDGGSLFPDTCPPTLSSACSASQANLRDIIRRCNIDAPSQLIISRKSKNPLQQIKAFWYRVLCTEGEVCPRCLKLIINFQTEHPLSLSISLKCDLGHVTISKRMMNIRILTASEDRLLKDSLPYVLIPRSINNAIEILKCPAICELHGVFSEPSMGNYEDINLLFRPDWSTINLYSCSLPTNSKCRVYESLSILKHTINPIIPDNGVIFGDGLGESSRLLSHFFPRTKWIASSLYDSENAIPQSYPHSLIPSNPLPEGNVDYSISKMQFNDLSSPDFVERWSQWISGGFCWCEIETKDSKACYINNLLSIHNWDLILLRVEFNSYEEASSIISLIGSQSENMRVFITGSLRVDELECIIILTETKVTPFKKNLVSPEHFARTYQIALTDLRALSNSLYYISYLSNLEEKDEVTRMIRRCDHWFAKTGITHLLSCTKLYTPLWWDIQTGKIPEVIRNLGANKVYYLYQSDVLALQARLISMALSCLKELEELEREAKIFDLWKIEITQSGCRIRIRLLRSSERINYGVDHNDIKRFVPILRKLNHLNNRWWRRMPDIISFHSNTRYPGFWVSNISQMLPVNLPLP